MATTKPTYDWKHRPESYWEHADPLQEILAGISGTARREMITDFWNAGQMEQLTEALLEDDLDEGSRQGLGRIHPFFMGGEYLPQRLPGEVVIVRIQLQSTTFDVIELRARPLPEKTIGLRWVDEYECPFHGYKESIKRPFSFRQLVRFIESTQLEWQGNLPHVYNEMNYQFAKGDAEHVERLRDFTTFSSEFYPELGCWAATEIDNWFDQQLAEEALEAEEAE
ncbi:MAG: hypothetical protein AB3N33_02790 [Puniceicoccaceae bacterium]